MMIRTHEATPHQPTNPTCSALYIIEVSIDWTSNPQQHHLTQQKAPGRKVLVFERMRLDSLLGKTIRESRPQQPDSKSEMLFVRANAPALGSGAAANEQSPPNSTAASAEILMPRIKHEPGGDSATTARTQRTEGKSKRSER
jgi:hypothetical protein